MDNVDIKIIDEKYIKKCNKLAERSLDGGDNFFGAIVTYKNKVLVECLNDTKDNITGHAEIIAIKKVIKKYPEINLSKCTLYSNFEPCPMCSFVIRDVGIGRVVFSAPSPFWGGYSRWDILETKNLHDFFTSNGNAIPPEVKPYVLKKETTLKLDKLGWKMHLPEFLNNTKNIVYNDKDIEKALLALLKKIKNVNEKDFKKVFSFWYKIKNNIDLNKIKKEVKNKKPELFKETMLNNQKIINYDKFLKFLEKDAEKFIKKIMNYEKRFNVFEKIEKKITYLKIKNKYFSRILSNNESLLKINNNGYRAIADNIAFRIIASNNTDFTDLLLEFENIFKDNIISKLNTFSFSDSRFKKEMGGSSINYKAVHYFLLVDGLIVEVQLRMWATNTWSKIHHDTLYKKNILIIPIEKKSIKEFGNIANIVDLYLINSESN